MNELTDERYDVIDKLVIESELIEFFNSVEKIQNTLMKNNIEAKEQFSRKVLESDDYYNGHVQVRVHKKHINGKIS